MCGGGSGALAQHAHYTHNYTHKYTHNYKLYQPAQGARQHESYTGDRTKEALEAFADGLVPSAGLPHVKHGQLAVRERERERV